MRILFLAALLFCTLRVAGQGCAGLPAGAVDTCFRARGFYYRVSIDSIPYVHTVGLLSDGRLMVGGRFHQYGQDSARGLVRLFPDGSIDPTFKYRSQGNFNHIRHLAVEASTSVIITPGAHRISPSGHWDSTFIDAPIQMTNPNGEVDVLPDGKLILSGHTIPPPMGLGGYYGPIRLNINGSLDTTFRLHSSQDIYQQRTKRDSLGRFVAVNYGTLQLPLMQRYASNGELDTAFEANLAQIPYLQDRDTATASDYTLNTVAFTKGGKIYFGGIHYTFGTYVNAVFGRLNEDGTLDTTFPTGGFTGHMSRIQDLLVQEDGNVIVLGGFTAYRGDSVFGICRLLPDGSLDSTFNAGERKW